MASAWRSKKCWAVFVSLMALTTPAFAAKGAPPPSAPPWSKKFFGSCQQQGNWIFYTAPGTQLAQKFPVTECASPDGQSATFIKHSCAKIAGATGQLVKLIETTEQCGTKQMCYAGVCKYPAIQKLPQATCIDSDHSGATNLWLPTAGSGLPSPTIAADDAQIFQPGKVTVSKGTQSTQDFADACKGPMLIESVCIGAGVQPSKQVAVKCPQGYQCNPQANVNNVVGAACELIPTPPPPFIDPCTPIDPTLDYPDATVVGSPGNWHIDICLPNGSDVVAHYQCKDSQTKLGITHCNAPELCLSKGLCNGNPPPEPEDNLPECEDTDLPMQPLGKPFGDPKVFGQIMLKGKNASKAADYCDAKNKYRVFQAKCDPFATDGYSFEPFGTLCPNDPDGTSLICIGGVCTKPSACACTPTAADAANNQAGWVSGSGQNGKPFGPIYDQCQGDLILKAACDNSNTNCYQQSVQSCPPTEACTPVASGGVCKPVFQPSCAQADPSDDKKVKGWVKGINKFKQSFGEDPNPIVDHCAGNTLVQVQCDVADAKGYTESSVSCAPDYCVEGVCVPCIDNDGINDTHFKGTAKQNNGQSHDDYCPVEGDKTLVQVFCNTAGAIDFNPPVTCPSNETCQGGACAPPIDKCKGVNVPSDNNPCTLDKCDPATGKPSYTPVTDPTACNDGNQCTDKDACVAGMCAGTPKITNDGNKCTKDACDPKTGESHVLIICAPPQTCNPATGVCETPPECVKDADCDDQDPCNGEEVCLSVSTPGGSSINGTCIAGSPPKEGDAGTEGCFDKDKDEITNSKDNCPDVFNPLQQDANNNKIGDACEFALAAHSQHACASFLDGLTRCWGVNNGELGIGKPTGTFTLPPVNTALPPVLRVQTPGDPYSTKSFLKDITSLALGKIHSCGVTKGSEVYCWGSDGWGQLSLSAAAAFSIYASKSDIPAQGALTVGAGAFHTCIVLTDHTATCVGGNNLGSLGTGDWQKQSIFALPMLSLNDGNPAQAIAQIAGGHDCTCDVINGQVKCTGDNTYGQLGTAEIKTKSAMLVDVHLPDQTLLKDVVHITSGGFHSCALSKDGVVYCWGYNAYAQLGFLPKDPYSAAAMPVTQLPIKANVIGAGDYHTCAGLTDGSVECWGFNDQGQLGSAPFGNKVEPITVTIPEIKHVIDLAGGNDFTCARLKNLSVACWGGPFAPLTIIDPYGVLMKGPGDPYGAPKDAYGGTPKDPYQPGVCGNWMVDAGEVCDQGNFGNQTCASFGYYGGKLVCATDCKSVSKAGCYGSPGNMYGGVPKDPDYVPACGNKTVDPNEACEAAYNGDVLWPKKTCKDFAFLGGSLKCTACQFDTSFCTQTPCGNQKIEPGEACDGYGGFGGKTCVTEGFYGGKLLCTTMCTLDTSKCYTKENDPYK